MDWEVRPVELDLLLPHQHPNPPETNGVLTSALPTVGPA